MTLPKRILALYARIVRTYASWATTLLPLAMIVFIPLGLVHAIPVHAEIADLDFQGGIHIFVLAATILTLAATGLIGEVFYTGAVAIALTHPKAGGEAPALREVARMVNYKRLIAIDLIYGVLVAVGLVVFIVPGLLVFVYLGLAAPVAEIERRPVRDSLARSIRLVRGNFWLVLAVMVPIELGSDALTNVAIQVSHGLLGDTLVTEWLADTATNIALTPLYAVAAVLLTIDLIAEHDGTEPRLHSAPASP